MIGRSGTMSPVSTDGSEWSGINRYQSMNGSDSPLSPSPFGGRSAATSPPTSLGPQYSPLGLDAPPGPNGLAPAPRPPGDPAGNPSPPSSVTSKSRISDGTIADQRSRRYRMMEDMLMQHYNVLGRFLQYTGREDLGSLPSNKAKDKLLRLSPVQFYELSTDVYDELQRRQAAFGGRGPPRPDVPPHLLPRKEFHNKRNQARQKLSSLQQQRFRDLATDVFCEIERRFPHFAGPDVSRRNSPAPSMRGGYGPPNGFPPRRDSNGYGHPGGPRSQSRGPGGRGYPSGGPPGGRFPPRQGSLGGPQGLGINGETIPENAPFPKTFQSNTIVPNKSTLVEDDDEEGYEDDDDGRSDAFALDKVLDSKRGTTTTLGGSEREKQLADSQAQVSSLQKKVEELEQLLKTKDEEVNSLRDNENSRSSSWDSERRELEDAKADLEGKLVEAQNINTSLQNELESARTNHQSMEEDLRYQLSQVSIGGEGDGEWKTRFEELDRKHQTLQTQLKHQQEITEQVRQEATHFLQEMRVLSEQSGNNWEREESLTREVHRLQEEVKIWKNRYAKSKAQLRHFRSSSLGLPGHQHDVNTLTKDDELSHPDGLVKDVHVTKFQMSIDELLRIARSGEPPLVLEQVKAVVIAVRHITQGIDDAATNGDDAGHTQSRAKTRVSATANNLITASKNFAYSNGMSPVSLLDAAASHLTAAVIEFIRTVKVRPTPGDELAEDVEEDYLPPMKSPAYFSIPLSQRRNSGTESVYSAISSPRSTRSRPTHRSGRSHSRGFSGSIKGAYSLTEQYPELEELRVYLEEQTDSLVQSIQALVTSIRNGDDKPAIRTHIDTISSVVTKVLSSSENAVAQPNLNHLLRDRAGPVIQTLSGCLENLTDIGAEVEQVDVQEDMRDVTSKLPPIAFQIARETKELIQRLDQVHNENGEEDDFR